MTTSKTFRLCLPLLVMPVLLLGCGSSPEDGRGVRVAVDGIVTIDGTELLAGRIHYVTNQGAGQVKATASIVQGYYRFTEENGPLAGKARVEIYPLELELEAYDASRGDGITKSVDFTEVKIPPRYNVRSTLEVDVLPDVESNLFSFDLTSE